MKYLTFIIEYKSENSDIEYEVRECVINSINLLVELIKEGPEVKQKEFLEMVTREYVTIYNNSVYYFFKILPFIKLLDFYIKDSNIVSTIITLFRKSMQIVCNISNPMLLGVLDMPPKEYCEKFKVYNFN